MKVPIEFIGVLLILSPAVMAIVNAMFDDLPKGRRPRWGVRLASIVVGALVSLAVAYLGAMYASWLIPLPVVVIAGVCLGLEASGIYDFGKLWGAPVQRK